METDILVMGQTAVKVSRSPIYTGEQNSLKGKVMVFKSSLAKIYLLSHHVTIYIFRKNLFLSEAGI